MTQSDNDPAASPEKKSTKKAQAAKPDQMGADVIAFITAIDDYKRIHNRPFPTWSEVLTVLKELGYSRAA